jgi:predicted RNA-binding protein
MEDIYLNTTKVMYNKYTDDIMLNRKKWKALDKEKDVTLTTFIQHGTIDASQSIRQEKEIKDTQIAKEEIKLSLFVSGIEDTKDPIKNLLEW